MGISRFTPDEMDELRRFDEQIDAEEMRPWRQYYQRHKDKLIEYQRQLRKIDPAKAAEYVRRYYESHREQVLEYKRQYYAAKKSARAGQ